MVAAAFASLLALTNLCGSVAIDTLGGRVVSYVPTNNIEVLARLQDGSGGIALCWPWFANDGPKGCRRHGVARYHDFDVVSRKDSPRDSELCLRLCSNKETRAEFPHEFSLTLVVHLTERLTLELIGENTGTAPFSVTEMFHPYFRVEHARACEVQGVDGLTYRDNTAPELGSKRVWKGVYRVGDGSRIFDFGNREAHEWSLVDHGWGRVIVNTSSGDIKTVVWSPGEALGKGKNVTSRLAPDEWKTFVCVENGTCYGDRGYILKPGERHVLRRTIATRSFR